MRSYVALSFTRHLSVIDAVYANLANLLSPLPLTPPSLVSYLVRKGEIYVGLMVAFTSYRARHLVYRALEPGWEMHVLYRGLHQPFDLAQPGSAK